MFQVRHPFSQTVSAFQYYLNVFPKAYLKTVPGPDPLLTYLNNPWKWEPHEGSYTHNRMIFDFGLDRRLMENATAVKNYINYLNRTFDLVMVSERYDESMVLLKRRMNWGLRDILYVKSNVFRPNTTHAKHANNQSSSGEKTGAKDSSLISDYHRETHRKFNAADYALYEHFSQLFDSKVRAEGEDFQEEVAAFQALRCRVDEYCNDPLKDTKIKDLVLEPGPWNKRMVVGDWDCQLMVMSERAIVNVQRQRQLARYTGTSRSL
jgi:hypothetical protein